MPTHITNIPHKELIISKLILSIIQQSNMLTSTFQIFRRSLYVKKLNIFNNKLLLNLLEIYFNKYIFLKFKL